MGTKKTDNKKTDNKKTPARDLAIDPNTGNVVEPIVDAIAQNGVNPNTLRIINILNENTDPLTVRQILFIAGRTAECADDLLSAHYTAKTLPSLVTHGICETVDVFDSVTNKKSRSAHYILCEGAMDRVNQGMINRASRPTRTRTVTATPMDIETYRDIQIKVDDIDALLTTIRNLARRDEDTAPKTGPINPVRVFKWDGETREVTSREFQTILQNHRKTLVTAEYRARRAVIVGDFGIGGEVVIESDTDAVAS